MEHNDLNVPLVKLPPDIELILFMIKEELKNTKLFRGLESAGLDDCFYQSDFSAFVLGYMGFDGIPDDLREFYGDLIDEYSKKIRPDNKVITKYAFDVYGEILLEQKRRFRASWHDTSSE